jgi:hypothetical protein
MSPDFTAKALRRHYKAMIEMRAQNALCRVVFKRGLV